MYWHYLIFQRRDGLFLHSLSRFHDIHQKQYQCTVENRSWNRPQRIIENFPEIPQLLNDCYFTKYIALGNDLNNLSSLHLDSFFQNCCKWPQFLSFQRIWKINHSSINFRTSVLPLGSSSSISTAARSVGRSPDDRLINSLLSETENGLIKNDVC